MNWKFWNFGGAGQPTTPNDEPLSGWRAVRAKVFSKKYGKTRTMLILTVTWFFFTAPVQPWVPQGSELHELVGLPHFQHFNTGKQSGINFTVDGITLNCSFSGTGGMNGCDQYASLVSEKKPVHATYFWMGRYIRASKMLNTLEQDGRVVVSADETYRQRLTSFNADKKSGIFLNMLFSLIVFVLWRIERSNEKQEATNFKN